MSKDLIKPIGKIHQRVSELKDINSLFQSLPAFKERQFFWSDLYKFACFRVSAGVSFVTPDLKASEPTDLHPVASGKGIRHSLWEVIDPGGNTRNY